MTAALYAIRSGKSVIIIEKEAFGGQMAKSPRIENYPSIKQISGLELANNMFDQIMDAGVEFDCDTVTAIKKENDLFYVTTTYTSYVAKSVVIATGVKHRHMGLDGEDDLIGKGLSYCAVCDGDFFKGKDVAIIGDANTALQYALMMADICPKVYLCMLFDKFFADDVLVKRVLAKENIIVTKEISLDKYLVKDDALCGLAFHNTKTNEQITFDVSGCFVAIGQIPENDIFKDICELDNKGYILSNDGTTKTPGLYVAGDCRTKGVRQITTAVSDGAVAAMLAVNYLNNK